MRNWQAQPRGGACIVKRENFVVVSDSSTYPDIEETADATTLVSFGILK